MYATVDRITKEVDEMTTGVLEVSFDDEDFRCRMLAAFNEKFFETGKETYIDLCLYPEEYRICKGECGYSEMIIPSDEYKDGQPYNTIKARVTEVDELGDEQYIYIRCFGKDLDLVCSKDTGETVHRGDVIEAKCWCEVCEGEPDISEDVYCMYLHQADGLELHDFREYFNNRREILKYCEAHPFRTKKEKDHLKRLFDRRSELIDELKKKAAEKHKNHPDNDDLEMVLGCLTDREEVLVRMKYGIDDGIKRDLEEISDKLGIDITMVVRVEDSALRKLNAPEKREIFEKFLNE